MSYNTPILTGEVSNGLESSRSVPGAGMVVPLRP